MSLRLPGIFTVATACGILGVLAGASAQANEGDEAVSYFPMIAGAAWTYDGFVEPTSMFSRVKKKARTSNSEGTRRWSTKSPSRSYVNRGGNL
jgi:hypothetical protein